jgi:hypothetical protein
MKCFQCNARPFATIVLYQIIDKRDHFHSILQHRKENRDLTLIASFFFVLFCFIYILKAKPDVIISEIFLFLKKTRYIEFSHLRKNIYIYIYIYIYI